MLSTYPTQNLEISTRQAFATDFCIMLFTEFFILFSTEHSFLIHIHADWKKARTKQLQDFISFGRKVSKNNTKTCWILKCDIRKFFASIDHEILLSILKKYISDENIIGLLQNIISSFHSTKEGVGLPLGNLTSQLLVNIYMNEFDQFVKHKLKVKYYVRYADDFVIFFQDKIYLESLISKIAEFLKEKLKLSLHPDKLFIKTLASRH